MFARIAYYHFKAGQGPEVARRAEAGMLPIFERHDGFRGYAVVLTEGDTGYSLSFWDSEAQASAAVHAAADWVKENVAELVDSVQNHVGDVAFARLAHV
jgi:heme-degrading monooxygenase HmoA